MSTLQEKTQGSGLMLWLAVTVLILAVLHRLLKTTQDPREPPYVWPTIPVGGHLIGILRDGAKYFTKLDSEYRQGLYTLPIPRGRLYIVGSADWSVAVQKHDSTIDLYTLTSRAWKTLFCMNKQSMEIVDNNLYGEKGHQSSNVMHAVNDVMFKTLAPGKDLDELNGNILRELEPRLNALAQSWKPEKMMFWDWIQHQSSEAALGAVYGPDNPFAKDPSLFDDFYDFDAGAAALMLMPCPAIFARRSHLARRKVNNAFIKYAKEGGYKNASALIQGRARECLAHGLAIDQYALVEVGFLPALLTNTAPASFWLISRIFQNAQLLADIRVEIDRCSASGAANKRHINIVKLRTQCPLLLSAFMETLRIVAPVNNYRYVREDTLVTNNANDNTYLLKKGSLVQLTTTILHARPEIWGDDVASFNERRFAHVVDRARLGAGMEGKAVDPAATFRDAKGKLQSGSFRPFGGGTHMCPGRHFAQTGVLALAALFIASFEMESEPGTGKYVSPALEDARGLMFLSVIKPSKDVEVTLRRRKGYEDTEWQFDM